MNQKILVTGGAGYIGTVLTTRLLEHGYDVNVLDTFWFGDFLGTHSRLTKIRGDLRDSARVEEALQGVGTVIHMACLSNDPTSDIDPKLTESINFTASVAMIHAAKKAGVRRFIYSSSASVYGVREEKDITEDLVLAPITLYSRYKAEIENELFRATDTEFTTVAIRNSTVCGYSPRMRLDTIINLFVVLAITKKVITIEGGEQLRPLIHMDDVVDFYRLMLTADRAIINGQAFNVSSDNYKVADVARMVQAAIPCELQFGKWTDPRSYHVSTEKSWKMLGFKTTRPIQAAISELTAAYHAGEIDPTDTRSYHIKHLKEMFAQNALSAQAL